MRTLGIEEELLVVDAETGQPRSVAARVLDRAEELAATGESSDGPGGTVGGELQRQQVETDTSPHTSLADLEEDLRRWRDVAIKAARPEGTSILAVGTSPVAVTPQIVPDSRYAEMHERFGLTAAEQLSCGCHVHVSVDSEDEAIAALNRIRVWLPTLLALSANSPFWQGSDTHYASYRSQVIGRWPISGPPELFDSGAEYRGWVDELVGCQVLLDAGMVYIDARPSEHYPTLEIRVADVCLDVRDTVLIGALARALVDTAVEDWKRGTEPAKVPVTMLRLATWQAAREGLTGSLLDPVTHRPRPAYDVLADLLTHVGPALRANGDEELVRDRVERLRERGNGAVRQRRVLEKTGQMIDVIADLAKVTAGLTD